MVEFNPKTVNNESASALAEVRKAQQAPEPYAAYVGMDVHKDTITYAVALPGRAQAQYRGEIAHTTKTMNKLIQRLSEEFAGELLLFCYEAGPTGYHLYRHIIATGHECQVVAPSKIPRKPGERIKTDRRDAVKLAQHLRSGDLTAVWVPDQEQEAMRDLTRARSDMKTQELKARQQLNAFVLRHGHSWPSNKVRWTRTHYNWLESLEFPHPWQHVVLQEYIDAVKAASRRVADLMDQVLKALPSWSLAPVVDSLVALRGIDKLSAITLLAELGDISRFDNPKQLMAYLGVVPSEHSTGTRRRQGAITLTGNGYARRILVESAWSYRFCARQTMHLKRKAVNASDEAKEIAWRAQKRLCGRYRRLVESGKNQKVMCVAIARELIGFIWDIVRIEMARLPERQVGQAA